MLGKQRRQPLARARREGRDEHALALALQAAHVGDGGLEQVAAFARPLGGEHRARVRPSMERTVPLTSLACSNGVR